jgi:hypothetical protein
LGAQVILRKRREGMRGRVLPAHAPDDFRLSFPPAREEVGYVDASDDIRR